MKHCIDCEKLGIIDYAEPNSNYCPVCKLEKKIFGQPDYAYETTEAIDISSIGDEKHYYIAGRKICIRPNPTTMEYDLSIWDIESKYPELFHVSKEFVDAYKPSKEPLGQFLIKRCCEARPLKGKSDTIFY